MKKTISLFIILGLLLSIAVVSVAAATGPFSDVPNDLALSDEIEQCYEYGLISGYSDGSFHPDSCVTRAQFVTMLWRAASKYYPDYSAQKCNDAHFKDTAEIEACYRYAVNWATALDIVVGYDDGCFRPTAPVTREQAAAFVYRFLCVNAGREEIMQQNPTLRWSSILNAGIMPWKEADDSFKTEAFADETDIELEFLDSVNVCYNMGIMLGVDGTPSFNPKGNTTRAAAAAVILRVYEQLNAG